MCWIIRSYGDVEMFILCARKDEQVQTQAHETVAQFPTCKSLSLGVILCLLWILMTLIRLNLTCLGLFEVIWHRGICCYLNYSALSCFHACAKFKFISVIVKNKEIKKKNPQKTHPTTLQTKVPKKLEKNHKFNK